MPFYFKSNTANDTGFFVKEKYGRAVIFGEYVTDQVKLDGMNAGVPLEIGVLSRASADFYYLQADGVFGLSFKDLVRGHGRFESAVHSLLSTVDKKQVNLWLNKATSNADRIGRVSFGKADSKQCKGSPAFYPNSFSYFFYVEKPLPAMPTLEFHEFVRAIGLNSVQSFDCSYVDGLDLQLKIGGNYYALSSDDYTYKDQNGNCNPLVVDNGNYDQDGNGWVLGEPFLRNVCIHWDVSTTAIGFSPAVSNS
ncbi:Peptidase A1 domain-containing protein [Aphelenchoides fujianensis]|nr:Peptidase A1 domain-containing protein [Aphelenchoides fujianensis]